ncbi:MAG TPA: FAD:protein FMN transferase [Flavobacteriaceae bacterium]|nr:FAD:protein FMN transferase [Flavobacteriaceae bacterium]
MRTYLYFLLILISFISCENKTEYISLTGTAFGTYLSIQYQDDLQREIPIDSLIKSVNKSLSTYDKTSDISRINQGDTTVLVDDKFIEVFNKSKRIFNETNGVFDPTIGVLVNAWDFGPEKKLNNLDSLKVKELMQQVGFDKVHILNNKVIKENSKSYFDFNAIAKGYGIDIIGRFLESKNILNYKVEIGGEVRVKGKSPSNKLWRIGIESPNFDGTQSIKKIISLNNESIATSGTYRKFKIDKNGNKYAHILNTKTGYPAKSNLLSASVIAPLDCADVDGYATTFIALGFEKSKNFLKNHQELKAYLIYIDKDDKLRTFQTENFEE